MFARILEFAPKAEKRDELIRTIRQEILPLMKKQPGFLELLPFVPDAAKEKMVTISMLQKDTRWRSMWRKRFHMLSKS